MTAMVPRCTIVAVALFIVASAAVELNAQCCGSATTAFYQPTTVTAYSPVVVQAYQPGWYPGFFLDRIRMRLWGAPNTYVAAYPTTFAAARPVHTVSYATSFAPVSACASCSSVQQVTMRPVVACDPCTACSPCSSCGVIQTSHVEPNGCSCGSSDFSGSTGTSIDVPSGTVVVPDSQQTVPSTGRPEIPEYEPTPEERTSQRPANGSEPGSQNGNEIDPVPANTDTDNATYLEPPKLFDPKDRTAARPVAPVRRALYEQPIGYQHVSARRITITADQAQRDAAGWTSASN
jgi:hypothetical protein